MKRFCSLVSVALAAALTSAHAHADERPFWLTPDNNGGYKAHRLYSAGIGGVGHLVFPEHPVYTLSACWAVGWYKEIKDYRSGSGASKIDLRNDALGCVGGHLAATGLMWLSDRIMPAGGQLSLAPDRQVVAEWKF